MDKDKAELRDINYFNTTDNYLFVGVNTFTSKVVFENGKVFTLEHPKRMQYKATTIKCVKL